MNASKTLIATGIALTLSGGAAAAAFVPSTGLAGLTGSTTGGVAAAALTGSASGGGAGVSERGLGGGLFDAAAAYIGITTDALRTELRAGASLADVAVAHGKTRDGLIAALTTAATARLSTFVDQKGLPGKDGERDHGDHARGPKGAPLAAAASYLGLDTATLRAKLAAGQTPAAVAAEIAGKTRDGLIAAIVADGKAKIEAAQAAGTLTAAQATEELAELSDHATKFVDRAGGPHHR